MKRPASLGQHWRMGNQSSEKLSLRMTSLHGPVLTVFGKNFPISARMGSIFTLSRKPWGDLTSMKWRIRMEISFERINFIGRFIPAALPNLFIRARERGVALLFCNAKAKTPGQRARSSLVDLPCFTVIL